MLNTKYIFIEFIIFFIILILPPLGISSHELVAPGFSFGVFQELIVSILLVYQYKNSRNRKDSNIFYTLSVATLTLGCLFLIQFSIEFVFIYIIKTDSSLSNFADYKFVSSFWSWSNVLITFFISAFYEELLYRFFFPDALTNLVLGMKNWKHRFILCFVIEVITVSIFAFSHRYLGYGAVVNAALCGLVLRLCFKSTKNIFAGAIIHFIYNTTLFVFAYLLQ